MKQETDTYQELPDTRQPPPRESPGDRERPRVDWWTAVMISIETLGAALLGGSLGLVLGKVLFATVDLMLGLAISGVFAAVFFAILVAVIISSLER